MSRQWWRWPANADNDYNPLYMMMWRALWFPVFLAGFGVMVLTAIAAYGWREGIRLFKEG